MVVFWAKNRNKDKLLHKNANAICDDIRYVYILVLCMMQETLITSIAHYKYIANVLSKTNIILSTGTARWQEGSCSTAQRLTENLIGWLLNNQHNNCRQHQNHLRVNIFILISPTIIIYEKISNGVEAQSCSGRHYFRRKCLIFTWMEKYFQEDGKIFPRGWQNITMWMAFIRVFKIIIMIKLMRVMVMTMIALLWLCAEDHDGVLFYCGDVDEDDGGGDVVHLNTSEAIWPSPPFSIC